MGQHAQRSDGQERGDSPGTLQAERQTAPRDGGNHTGHRPCQRRKTRSAKGLAIADLGDRGQERRHSDHSRPQDQCPERCRDEARVPQQLWVDQWLPDTAFDHPKSDEQGHGCATQGNDRRPEPGARFGHGRHRKHQPQ